MQQQGYTRIWSGPDSRMIALSSLEDWTAGSNEERKRVRPASNLRTKDPLPVLLPKCTPHCWHLKIPLRMCGANTPCSAA